MRPTICIVALLASSFAAAAETQTLEADPVLKVGDTPVAVYRTTPTPLPEGIPAYFARTGCLHPVYSPSGRVVTGSCTPDHRHHHGIYSSYIRTRFDGRSPNFWDMGKDNSRVEHVSYQREGDTLIAELRYVDLTAGAPGNAAAAEPVIALHETWRLTPQPELSKKHGVLVFDLELTQRCATDKPLVIEQFRIGGLLVRGSNEWTDSRFGTLTSEGKGRTNSNHTRPRWTALTGAVDGTKCGIAVIDHPSNFRHPQWVRTVPTQPYAVMSPMVGGEYTIEPGKAYTARYRLVTFDGEPEAGKLNAITESFASP